VLNRPSFIDFGTTDHHKQYAVLE